MKLITATAKALVLFTVLAMLVMPAVAADKIQTGASKGDAKKHKKSYKTPCVANCEDNSTRNLKNR